MPDLCGARNESNVTAGLCRNWISWARGLRTRGDESAVDGLEKDDESDEDEEEDEQEEDEARGEMRRVCDPSFR